MSIHLTRDMEKLQKRVLQMAGDVEAYVEKAISALFNRDAEMARDLMESDNAIDLAASRSDNAARRTIIQILTKFYILM